MVLLLQGRWKLKDYLTNEKAKSNISDVEKILRTIFKWTRSRYKLYKELGHINKLKN
jgi:hypothetical protein